MCCVYCVCHILFIARRSLPYYRPLSHCITYANFFFIFFFFFLEIPIPRFLPVWPFLPFFYFFQFVVFPFFLGKQSADLSYRDLDGPYLWGNRTGNSALLLYIYKGGKKSRVYRYIFKLLDLHALASTLCYSIYVYYIFILYICSSLFQRQSKKIRETTLNGPYTLIF